MSAQRERRLSPMVCLAGLLAFLVGTRWPLAPHYLYYFDSANFALALERFNPAMHQPQPPGYPLFVALTRIIHLLVGRPETVFLIAGLLAAGGAVLLIYGFAKAMFGREAGLLSAALLAANPAFWFGGITNEIRVFLAFWTLAVGWLGWRALQQPDHPGWLYAAAAALGVAGGFRPELPLLLAPLLVWIWARNGARLRTALISAICVAATTLPWLSFTIWVVGGPKPYLDVIAGYASNQFEGTSAIFGAAPPSAWHMFAEALTWNFLGAIVWLWAAPWAKGRFSGNARLPFLALAFLPAFLFSALVHIGDPDQALASVAVLCLAGGGVLAGFRPNWTTRQLIAAAVAVLAVQTVLFFKPPTKLAKSSSYKAVAAVDGMTTGAIDAVRELSRGGPVTIVHYGSPVASRQLAWYFPDDYLVVLPEGQVFFRHRPLPAATGSAGFLRPGSNRVVCLMPLNAQPSDLPGWRRYGPVFYLDLGTQQQVAIGPFTVVRQIS